MRYSAFLLWPVWLCAAVLGAVAVSADPLDEASDLVRDGVEKGAASQRAINRIDDETRRLREERRALLARVESLETYLRQLRARDMEREILPLAERMVGALDEFVRLDVPFLPGERGARVERLKAMLPKSGLSASEKFRRILEVNLLGTFLMCRAALPHLLESRGAIVNTSSTAALAGMPYAAAYGASKGGVSALTRTLAVEFAKQGLRCNAVCPGSIRTPMTGSGSLPENADLQLVSRAMPLDEARGPEAVAGLIALLASEDGRHINGEEVRVDGGTLA